VVDVYINYLRRKLHDAASAPNGDAPSVAASLIRTVRGVGYTIGAEA
jgi:DNA-binding response OmpR family regulator